MYKLLLVPLIFKSNKTMFRISLFMSLLILFSCKTKKVVETNTNTSCTTIAMVKDYTGLDGCQFLLVLENGEKWLPAKVNDKDFVFKDNQKIKFGYIVLEDMMSICMSENKSVELTCIEIISDGNSTTKPKAPKGMPEKKPCVETTNPNEVAWMAELIKKLNPLRITRYNYLDGFAYLIQSAPVGSLYDCQGTFLCEVNGKIITDCSKKVNQLKGQKVIWKRGRD